MSEANFSDHSETGGWRALVPLSPVHLKASPEGGGVRLSWIRRSRIDADGWNAGDIPLGEEREEYQVQIAHAGGPAVRTEIVTSQAYLYTDALMSTDFGTTPAEIDVTVRQLSTSVGWGLPATQRLSLH